MNIYDIEFQQRSNLDIPVDTWKNLLSNETIFNIELKDILFSMYSFIDHSATVMELEVLTGIKHQRINLIIGNSAKKIKQYLNKDSIYYKGREIYYPFMFIGYQSKNGFIFEIRENLRIALEETFSDLKVLYLHEKSSHHASLISENTNGYNLLSDIGEIVLHYPSEKKKKFGKTPFSNKMSKDMNNHILDFLDVYGLSDSISSTMHLGKGSWVSHPWFGIHDKSYSIYKQFSFQNSLHLSYIINCDDEKNLVLTLEINQGYNNLDLNHDELKLFLNELYSYLNFVPEGFRTVKDDKLNFYTLLSKSYDINSLTEDVLVNEFRSLLCVFEHILPFHYKLLKRYLREPLTKKVLKDYKEIMDVYPTVMNQPLKNHPFAEKMRKDFTSDVELWINSLTDSKYIIKISHGMGVWVKRPWVGIRLSKAAKSFEDGLYVIYHFNFDKNNIDFSINQGLDNFKGNKRKIVIDRAKKLSTKVNQLDGFTKENDSSFETTETSVLFRFYDLDDLSPNEFLNDLKYLLNEYENIIPEYNNMVGGKNMTEEKYGVLNVNDKNVWKITPGSVDIRDDIWSECKEKGFISIGFSSGQDVDYNNYASLDELRDALLRINPKLTEGSTAFQMVWNFVHEVRMGDVVVANNGLDGKVYGIGIVESDYIPPNKVDIDIDSSMRHIRRINWIISDEFDTDVTFDRKTITKLNDKKWNSIVKSILDSDISLRNESLKCIFDEFKKFQNTPQSEELLNKYSECSEKFRADFENIKISINDGNDETDHIFYNLIDPKDSLFKGFATDKKQMMKRSFNLSEDKLSNIATLYLNLIDNYTASDEHLRHEIFKFDDNELTKSIKTAYVSASLYYLDNERFYPINKKTIDSIKFLSNYIDIGITFDNKLVSYIDNNIKYHEYIERIVDYIPELNSFEIFDHFCHWLCDKKLGYYAASGKLPLCIKNSIEIGSPKEIIDTKAFNINPDDLKTNLKIDMNILYQSAAILNSSKNIIFEGVPGTGKTKLAIDICEYITNEHFCNGYLITTATSDWTTFDVIGGLMPDTNGNLNFEEGIFLKAIRENKILIIDEINRADIDKAFGQLFTVLSGSKVELNYKIDENNISIDHTDELESYYDNSSKTYYIGKNFRILATMNNYDKDSLYELSYAFMRRFAFVEVDIPCDDDYEELIDTWTEELPEDLHEDYINGLKLLLKINKYRKLGPAIFKDMISYMEHRLKFEYNDNVLEETILSYILPQFEGLSKNKLEEIRNLLVTNNLVEKDLLDEKISEISGLNF